LSQDPIGIGLIGCGTVGQGVVRLLDQHAPIYAQRVGRSIDIRRVLVRDASVARDVPLSREVFTTDPEALFGDDQISVVVEVAGGVDPMADHVHRALASGRHVVTANKALLAARGGELYAQARSNDLCIAFEASCGGGIPILAALKFGLSANRIESVCGVLNGTCNYILTEMTEFGTTYADALADAQRLGFAEADPALDVSGADAAQKLAIIASLAFGVSVHEADVSYSGIDRLELDDIAYGAELGYQLKLLAIGAQHPDGLELDVAPCFIAEDHLLSHVRGTFNALSVQGSAVGPTLFYGHGAGQMPTASAVVSDLLNVVGGWYPHAFASMRIWPDQHQPTRLTAADDLTSRYYLRIHARDEPGVMAAVASVLGDREISISAMVQHEAGQRAVPDVVPVVITTHLARRGAIREAVARIAGLESVVEPPVCIRIVDLPEG